MKYSSTKIYDGTRKHVCPTSGEATPGQVGGYARPRRRGNLGIAEATSDAALLLGPSRGETTQTISTAIRYHHLTMYRSRRPCAVSAARLSMCIILATSFRRTDAILDHPPSPSPPPPSRSPSQPVATASLPTSDDSTTRAPQSASLKCRSITDTLCNSGVCCPINTDCTTEQACPCQSVFMSRRCSPPNDPITSSSGDNSPDSPATGGAQERLPSFHCRH